MGDPGTSGHNFNLSEDDIDRHLLPRQETRALEARHPSRGSTKSFRLKDMLWVERLRSAVQGDTVQNSVFQTSEAATLDYLKSILEYQAKQEQSDPNEIPLFFKQKPEEGSLSSRLQRLSRIKFLKKQAELILDQKELEVLWCLLRENRTLPDDDAGSERINYDDFCHVAKLSEDKIGYKAKRFFSAATFLTFEADDFGRIAILPFYLYVMRWMSITQSRIDMCMLDKDGDGYLLPQEMEAYIRQLIPSMRYLREMEPHFLALYCRIAARKFLFFCDPQRRGKLLIREVLLSPVLSELMELRQDEDELTGGDSSANLADNWFAVANARRVYHIFVALDLDRNGTLSKNELKAFADENLTDIFIERVFDEQVRRGRGERGHGREMDLNNFLDLVLALENRHTPEGLAYIFRCMDLRGKGQLTPNDVYTLFRSVHRRWIAAGNYELQIDDVKDEIWDMVKPQNPKFITFDDLLQCQQGHTVASMLIDVGGFWTHDNRETLAAQQDAERE